MPKFKHVCIIDDDPIYTFTTRRIMEKGDFAIYIEVFKNGKEALLYSIEIGFRLFQYCQTLS